MQATPSTQSATGPKPRSLWPAAAATGPAPAWEILPNLTRIARVGDRVLVVRPSKNGAFRFVVMRQAPGGRGLAVVASGRRSTVQDAMSAAEQAITPRAR